MGDGHRIVRTLAAVLVLASACTTGDDTEADPFAKFADCTIVDATVSSEKIELLTALADTFNRSDEAKVGDDCVAVRVQKKASGGAATLLAHGWPNESEDGPKPVVWSPAASSWGGVLNQRLADEGEGPMAPDGKPFMLTPLVIAMPKPMAEALGWPDAPIGYSDILALARDPGGWASKGHPEWGPFRLGKTNPNFSTSALSATTAQYYAATGKTKDLTLEDIAKPEVQDFARGVEAAVVHYGDITMTFLNNWFRNDRRGTALTYVSAVAIEEKSVIDYNNGNPDGILDAGEKPRDPRIPLVAIYPKEGTLFSDNPYFILDAPWVDDIEKEGARKFEAFIMRAENQKRVLEYGFRPGNPEVAVGAPITPANGVDPDQPQTTLEVPEPEVLTGLIDAWDATRKRARVLLVLDVSGSMGEEADPSTGATKLDLAKDAAIAALDEFQADDEIGLWVFTIFEGTGDGDSEREDYKELAPLGPASGNREAIEAAIRDLVPVSGTPLYRVTEIAFDTMHDQFDPARINAIVLLTDGRNEDDLNDNLDALLGSLRSRSEGESVRPVRVFPIAYGSDSDLDTLRRIAEATNAAVYNATDPTDITNVLQAVVSNF